MSVQSSEASIEVKRRVRVECVHCACSTEYSETTDEAIDYICSMCRDNSRSAACLSEESPLLLLGSEEDEPDETNEEVQPGPSKRIRPEEYPGASEAGSPVYVQVDLPPEPEGDGLDALRDVAQSLLRAHLLSHLPREMLQRMLSPSFAALVHDVAQSVDRGDNTIAEGARALAHILGDDDLPEDDTRNPLLPQNNCF